MKNKNIIIFTVIILIAITGLFALNVFLKKNMIEEQKEAETEGEIISSIVVPEQAGGTNVFIESVTLPSGGYVVIHREDDGKSGVIIGVSEFLPAGTTTNFLMDTDEEVIEGDSLFAMLHVDDGDGAFVFPGADVPLTDSEGNIVLTNFLIVGEGALENEVKL
jgi:hypothetical protein